MVNLVRHKVTHFFTNGHQRTQLVKKNVAVSLLSKGGSIAIGLLLVPMTIDYVSPTEYGVWLTISSVLGWLNFFDIGLGNGLKNKLSYALALGQTDEAKAFTSTTYFVLTIIATAISILFIWINPYVDWRHILNIQAQSNDSLQLVMLIAILFFCVQFVVQLINTILSATHQTSLASLISLFSQLLILLLIYACRQYVPGKLTTLVWIVAGAPVCTMLIWSVYLFHTRMRAFRPSLKAIRLRYTNTLLGTGLSFFFIQIGALVLLQTNYIIIARILGPEQVTVFNICYKLFSISILVFTIIMTPLWSSFTDAYAKQDFDWLRQTLQKMRQLWLFFSVATVGLLVVSPYLFQLWIGQTVTIPFSLSLCMAIYSGAMMWYMIHVYLLNGVGKVRLQLILILISAALNVPLAIGFGKWFGLPGIVGANTCFFIAMGFIFSIQASKLVNQTASKLWNA
ncbi:lipopolysaccharide biosynthesis protein [Spirosoma luteolum]